MNSGARANKGIGSTHQVTSKDGTTISYLSVGDGPPVLVLPGVLSTASDYAAFARALAEHFAVHTLERRGRGESGPQGEDYSILKECEDVMALQQATGASLLVGHSYGGLMALEVARHNDAFIKVAVYEPGVSIDGSMGIDWMPRYEKKLAENKKLDALVGFTLADAPEHLRKTPPWLMKLLLLLFFLRDRSARNMLNLLPQNACEWREIARLDNCWENYRKITAGVMLMYGGKSDSTAVSLVIERLPAVIPHSETKEFPKLDHFGIERTAPREVAKVVSEFFLR
jgi:pimeloyl-ACP methyl ester carboxylesterase